MSDASRMSSRSFIHYFPGVSGLLLLLIGCSDNLNINTTGEPVPVVYSLINPDDTVHYVNLTRSFSGLEPASVLARDTSLLYYEYAEVYLEIVSNLGWPTKYASFTPIIGPEKESGIFIESPNKIFSYSGKLNSYLADGYTVRLIVNIPDIPAYCSASQVYFQPPGILLPTPSHQTTMNLYYGEPIQIKWEDKYGYSSYRVTIRFNYIEYFEQDSFNTHTDVSFDQDGTVNDPDQESAFLIRILDGDTFLKLLAQAISTDNSVLYRKFSSFDIIVTSASPAFRDYLESYNVATDRFGIPISNIMGGIGLFCLISKSEQVGFLLDQQSIDSLSEGQYTNHLKFIKWQ
jgi:hypothetical protein